MATKENLELMDFTIGLYGQALKLLEPGSDNFSILSGCILLTIGLEKMIKSVLYTQSPLMILYKKIEFEDLVLLEKGEKFNNRETISFEYALKRLVQLFPSLTKEAKDIEDIVKERNFLMHNFGYIEIGRLERKVQTKIADISELICMECLNKSPEEIFGQDLWTKMDTTRKAYINADVLEINQRITHLKRLYSKGEILPCETIVIPEDLLTEVVPCPVCERNTAEVALDWDLDVDHRENIVLNAYPYLSLIKCQCGFTMSNPEEIETLIASKYSEIIKNILAS